MPPDQPAESVSLHYRQGSSDKVYQANLEPSKGTPGTSGGFVVHFAFGRRGATLQTGTKTTSPVDYPTAKKIYDKLVQEKMAKGYTPAESGTPYRATEREARSTGVFPQLLNPIDDVQAGLLITDSSWWMQEKFDGKRLLVGKAGNEVTGINRKGLTVSLPQTIVDAANAIPGDWLMDGEAIGDLYFSFDLLELAGDSLRPSPYSQRLQALRELKASASGGDAIQVVNTADTTPRKRAMLLTFRGENKEGVVFKRHDAPYTSGRPATGGSALKLKFTTSASCLVGQITKGKRSVSLQLLDSSGTPLEVGNVTILPNHPIPEPGDIVEVRYLYAFPGEGGRLYQPVYLGKRDDIARVACTVAQLKFKAGEDDSDDVGLPIDVAVARPA